MTILILSDLSFAGIGGSAGGSNGRPTNYIQPGQLNPQMEWSTILGNQFVSAKAPAAWFHAGLAATSLPVIDVCKEDNLIRSNSPVDIFDKGSKGESIVVAKDYVYTSANYTTTIQGKNVTDVHTVESTYLQDYEIPITMLSNVKSGDGLLLFKKTYSIPDCSEN